MVKECYNCRIKLPYLIDKPYTYKQFLDDLKKEDELKEIQNWFCCKQCFKNYIIERANIRISTKEERISRLETYKNYYKSFIEEYLIVCQRLDNLRKKER